MTDKYAVIGNPIAHSKSPQIHKMFAQQTGQDLSYEAVLAPLDGFAATVERLRHEGYQGCNVTVPFKFEAFKLCTALTHRAKTAQAVNTLKFDGNEILGDNTDGAGLVADIERNLDFVLRGRHVLLLGAGGAAYGVSLPLLASGAMLTIANRTKKKADLLVETLRKMSQENTAQKTGQINPIVGGLLLGSVRSRSYASLAGNKFYAVINATSSGLSGEMPPLPRGEEIPPRSALSPFVKGGSGGIFAPGALAYDLMYGTETPFMKFAREQGAAKVADGLGMLVEQAAETFLVWRGVRPDTQPILAKLRLS